MGRVGSDFLSAITGRVNVSSGRVRSGPRKVTRGQLSNDMFPFSMNSDVGCFVRFSQTINGS